MPDAPPPRIGASCVRSDPIPNRTVRRRRRRQRRVDRGRGECNGSDRRCSALGSNRGQVDRSHVQVIAPGSSASSALHRCLAGLVSPLAVRSLHAALLSYSSMSRALKLIINRTFFAKLTACLVPPQFPKSCYNTCHIECLRPVHGALNVDEKKN